MGWLFDNNQPSVLPISFDHVTYLVSIVFKRCWFWPSPLTLNNKVIIIVLLIMHEFKVMSSAGPVTGVAARRACHESVKPHLVVEFLMPGLPVRGYPPMKTTGSWMQPFFI